MSAKTDKAQLAKGALAIRKAEREQQGKPVAKLDGTIEGATKEICRLHGEILSAAKTSLQKAILIGELLQRVRGSRKGKWLEWLEDNVPFSRATAYNYMACFERREFLTSKNFADLNEAYALMYPSKDGSRKTRGRTVKGIGTDTNSAAGNGSADNTPMTDTEPTPAPLDDEPKPLRHKSQKQIMKELQQIGDCERDAEIAINDQLAAIVMKLRDKVRAQWLEFPGKLADHGKALVKLAESIGLNTPRA